MKTASELRKSLDEALKPDTSGKTTPIQRLTPFLRELVTYLEAQEAHIQAHDGSMVKYPCGCVFGFTADGYVQTVCETHGEEIRLSSNAATQAVPEFLVDQLPTLEPNGSGGWTEPVSSADATEFAPPQKNSESGGASKASA